MLAAISVAVAYAAGLGPINSPSLGAGGANVDSPPVTIGTMTWDTEFEAGEYRVKNVIVPVSAPTGQTLELVFRMTLTQSGNSLGEVNVTTLVDEPPAQNITFPFNGQNIAVADVDDIHLLVCDNDGSQPNGKCFVP